MSATLIGNLSLISSIKDDIRDAISAKGVDMTSVPFSEYASKIGEIQTGGTFVTEVLSVSVNNTYYPGQGVDGFSKVVVNVPQSVEGYTEKDLTEQTYTVVNLNNSASFVASNAFSGKNTLLTVNLPNCTVVNNGGFRNCRNLSQVSLPVCESIGNFAFQQVSLSVIDLPECTYIGSGVFGNCTYLTQANLPKCTTLMDNAFESCTALTQVNIPECTSIVDYAFNSCLTLQSISIPYLEAVKSNVFNNCRQLSQVYLTLVTDVYNYAFANCWALSSIELPMLSYLRGSNVFNNCSALSKVSFPICNMVPGYGTPGFSTCSQFNEITFGADLYFVPSYISLGASFIANNGVINVDADMYDQWVSHTSWGSMSAYFSSYVSVNSGPMLSVSDGVLYGRTGAIFSGWNSYVSTSAITSVNLPQCKMIGFYTFKSVTNLTSVSLPNCKVLAPWAFYDCFNLSEIVLPVCELFASGYSGPFKGFSGTLTMGASTVCKLTRGPFQDGTPASIFVPASLVDSYKSAQYWSQYSNKIFPIT